MPQEAAIHLLAKDLVAALHQMDSAADTPINGYRAGLCGYETHMGYSARRHEAAIRDGVAAHLRGQGYCVQTEVPYPKDPRKKCDLVVSCGELRRLWLEIKIAWKAWFSTPLGKVEDKTPFFRSYLLGPAEGALSRSHSLVQDFQKLDRLAPCDPDSLGLLLLGFAKVADPIGPDIQRLSTTLRLPETGWRCVIPVPWADPNCSATQREVWFWWRRASGAHV